MARVAAPEAPRADVASLVDESHGNFCLFEDGRLVHPFDATAPSALTAFVHDSFRSLVLNAHFSCVGARAAVHQNAYRFGLYNELGSEASSAALALDLTRFNGDAMLRDKSLSAFVASFLGPVPSSEVEFEALLWSALRQLEQVDQAPWTPARAADPASPEFGFSFGGVGLFVVGLHAGSSRVARRFAFPTLVFNPHEQFDRLRQHGKYARFRDVIRARDADLQGTINPMIADFGEVSEARQYSGRAVDAEWRCPFSHRNGEGRRRGTGSDD